MVIIHPTSVVEPGARIADGACIGPFCHIGPKVTLGARTRLVSHVCITGRTTLGECNTIWPQAVLGADPQDLKFQGEDSELIIGDHNEIRELVTMHKGTANGGGVTRVGSHNLIMVDCHVAHDCLLGDHIVIANSVGLAGHVVVEDHAAIGGIVGVHHFVTFGTYCFVGGMSRITRDVPPYMVMEGNPPEVRGINAIGLERNGFSAETILHLKDAYRRLFRGGGQEPKSMAQRLDQLQNDYPDDRHIKTLGEFLQNMAVGVFGRYREAMRADSRRRKSVTG